MHLDGEKIEQLRTSMFLSATGLAAKAGIHHKTILSIERGERTRIHGPTLKKLCEALGVVPMDIMSDDDTASRKKSEAHSEKRITEAE